MRLNLIAVISTIIFLLPLPASGQAVVEAVGLARIEPDLSLAREIALLRAKQQALELLGTTLEAKTTAAQGRLLDEMIDVRTSGHMHSYEILEEGEKEGLYRVRIRAKVEKGKPIEGPRKAHSAEPTIQVLEKGPGSAMLGTEIREGLLGRGYQVLDGDQQDRVANYRIQVDSRVDLHSDLGEFQCFSVDARIDVTQPTVKRLVARVETDGPVLIYGKTLAHALNGNTVNQYRRRVDAVLLPAFWNKLDAIERTGARLVHMEISGLPDLKAFERFREYVRSICLGGSGLQGEQFESGVGLLDVFYKEKSLYLATIIGYRPEYRVLGYHWDRLLLAYEHGKVGRR